MPLLSSSSVSVPYFIFAVPCQSVWENACAWVPHFLWPYRMVLAFSDIATASAQRETNFMLGKSMFHFWNSFIITGECQLCAF